ncbi:alpha/beta fold hydrolase [Polyangium mundeleinium]|uniref:Alpha/beta hydrolase n=1 Tax=Polyangium mundeleinium TaxID=2995306 RepID=A0ABT5EZM0_9BACT|nr:alpha/beta hydrolase [Polyangium mundeleinium]MDC0747287.1 alpha/beta hydrolase [Polyangium mundeleinium]
MEPTPSSRQNNARVLGAGETTIVLAHGFGTDQTAWRHQASTLAERHRVLLFDHVGAGSSDLDAYSPRRYQSLRSYAMDLLLLLEELALEDVVYVGHSMSGMIGLLAAVEEPSRFRKLVLLGASPRYLDDVGYEGGFKRADLDGLYRAMQTNFHAWASGFAPIVTGNPDRPDLARDFAASLGALRPDIVLTVARIIFESDHRKDLPKLTLPTLVLQSQADVAVPMSVGTYLTNHIPRAELQVLDATGHMPHWSAPEQVTRAIQSFAASA